MNDLYVTLIQSDLQWEKVDANLASFEEKIWQIKGRTDLIILPEMFSTGFSMNAKVLAEPVNGKTFRWMKQMSEQTGAHVMGSYIIQEKGNFYNRLYVVKPDGSSLHYNKKHLFGLAREDKEYTPGDDRLIFDLRGWKVFPLICYDLRFPVWTRSVRTEDLLYEYDLIIFIASWPKPRTHAWDTLLQARAIENISYSIGVNRIGMDGTGAEYVGHSAVYDYLGEAVQHLGSDDSLATVKLDAAGLNKFRQKFPFQADSDSFNLA